MSTQLYDILVRHQIYIEGYKNFNILKFRAELPGLVKDIKEQFNKLEYNSLDQLTKRELKEFIRDVREINIRFFDYWNNEFLKELEEFSKKDTYVNKAIIAGFINDSIKIEDEKAIDKLIKDETKEDNENKIFPFRWVNDKEESKIYNAILNSIIPAIGLTVMSFIANLGYNSTNRIEQTINAGIANKLSVNEILTTLIGTKDNGYKDGVFVAIDNANKTIVNTTIQHTTSILEAAVQSLIYDKYRWISVIDSVTTDICRYRNKRIYYYGKGPLPPAHPNCRSKIKPVVFGQITPDESFFDWIKRQPEKVQKDVLSKKRFKALKAGELTAKDLPTYQENIPLNLEEFGSKIDNMLTR